MTNEQKTPDDLWLKNWTETSKLELKRLENIFAGNRYRRDTALEVVYKDNLLFVLLKACREIVATLDSANAERDRLETQYKETLEMFGDSYGKEDKGND